MKPSSITTPSTSQARAARPPSAIAGIGIGIGRRRRGAVAAPSVATTTATTTTTTTAPPSRVADQQVVDDMKSSFSSLLEEYAYDVPAELIDGAIPPELVGTLYRNGGALHVAGRHTFDADGCAVSLCFPGKGQPPRFRNAYVRTPGFVLEQEAQRPMLRTAFTRGSPQGGWANPLELLDFDRLKNVSNTGLLQWGGKLLSLYESHRPTELRPGDLSTVGETDLGGQLRTPRLAAHYRITAENGRGGGGAEAVVASSDDEAAALASCAAREGEPRRWVAFSANSGAGGSKILFYEFWGDHLAAENVSSNSSSGGASSSSSSSSGPELIRPPIEYALVNSPVALVHDLAVTRDYYVVYESPLTFNVKKFALDYLVRQTASVAECLEFAKDTPARVHFVPRPGGRAAGQPARVAECPSRFCFHHANAFQLDVVDEETEGGEGGGGGGGGGAAKKSGNKKRVRVALDGSLWDEVSFTLTQHTLTPGYYEGGARSQLRRLVFDLGPAPDSDDNTSNLANANPNPTSTTTPLPAKLVSDTNLLRRTAEFPSVDWRRTGRAARCVYASVDAVDDARLWGPAQAVAKITIPPTLGFFESKNKSKSGANEKSAGAAAAATAEGVKADVWEPGPRYIVGEPLFVPRPGRSEAAEGEDDGWVIVVCQNAETQKGEVAILDARDLSKGPIARLRLPHFLPSGLHGSFTPGGLESLSAPVGPPRRIREYK